jgi:hypothetical protein
MLNSLNWCLVLFDSNIALVINSFNYCGFLCVLIYFYLTGGLPIGTRIGLIVCYVRELYLKIEPN